MLSTYYVVSMSVLDPYHDDLYPPFVGLHNCVFLCVIPQLFLRVFSFLVSLSFSHLLLPVGVSASIQLLPLGPAPIHCPCRGTQKWAQSAKVSEDLHAGPVSVPEHGPGSSENRGSCCSYWVY